jgi:hypothetical protein
MSVALKERLKIIKPQLSDKIIGSGIGVGIFGFDLSLEIIEKITACRAFGHPDLIYPTIKGSVGPMLRIDIVSIGFIDVDLLGTKAGLAFGTFIDRDAFI